MFFCLVFVMPSCTSVYLCLVVTCWESVDLLAITVCLSLSHWNPGTGVDCIDSSSCTRIYFYYWSLIPSVYDDLLQ